MTINDYAYPMIAIEKLMRDMYDLCLEKNYEQAGALTASVIAEARVLQATLALMAADEARVR